jgi:hypothetical protein
MRSAPSANDGARQISPAWRSVVSLLLVIHIFVVFAALSSYSPSGVQQRLVWALRIYLHPLNFLVNFTSKFHLTHNSALDDAIEVRVTSDEAADQAAWTLPGDPRPAWEPYRRRKQFAFATGSSVDFPESRGILLEAIARRYMAERNTESAKVLVNARIFPSVEGRMLDDRPRAPGDPPPDGTGIRKLVEANAILLDGKISLIEAEGQTSTAPAAPGRASNPPVPQ